MLRGEALKEAAAAQRLDIPALLISRTDQAFSLFAGHPQCEWAVLEPSKMKFFIRRKHVCRLSRTAAKSAASFAYNPRRVFLSNTSGILRWIFHAVFQECLGKPFLILHGQADNGLSLNDLFGFFQSGFKDKIRACASLHSGGAADNVTHRLRDAQIHTGGWCCMLGHDSPYPNACAAKACASRCNSFRWASLTKLSA